MRAFRISEGVSMARTDACSACGASVQRRATSAAKIVCQDCRRQAREFRERNTYCDGCSKLLTVQQVRNGSRFCGRVCAQITLGPRGAALSRGRDPRANQRKCAARRARVRGVTVEVVDPTYVFDRDRWRCHVCGQKVDPSLNGLDLRGPTLDHIVPLSEGGEHSHANVRLAHRECNSRRSNRGGGEQLALIG